MEVPIRTYRNGAWCLAIAVTAVFASGWATLDTAHAQPVSTTQVAKTYATKGVRTTTAYQKRAYSVPTQPAKPKPVKRTTAKASKSRVAKAAPATKRLAIPAEVAADANASQIAQRALSVLGARYRWGGTGYGGFDCSGLIKYAYGAMGGILPRTSQAMYSAMSKVSQLRPGDVVFFGRGRARHSAIYVGNGQVVHASTPRSGVRLDTVSTLSRALGFLGVGRI